MDLDMTSIVWFWVRFAVTYPIPIPSCTDKKVCKVSVKFVYFTKVFPSVEMSKGISNKMSLLPVSVDKWTE